MADLSVLEARQNELSKKNDALAAENKSLKEKLMSTPALNLRSAEDELIASSGGWDDNDAPEVTIVSGRDDLRGPQAGGLSGRNSGVIGYKSRMKSLVKNGYRPCGEFKSFGEFIKFGLENRGAGDRHKIESRVGTHLKAIQGLTTVDGADGGFTVMPEFSKIILERMYGNSLWESTDSYNVTGDSMTFLASAETSRANGQRAGGMQGYWVGEGQSITKSKPTLREVNVRLGKLAIVVYLTNELMNDNSYALEQRVVKQAAAEFNFLKGDSLFNGVGTGGQPTGWLNSPNLIVVNKDLGQDPATITTNNVENLYQQFFYPFLPNAKWYHHQNIQPQIDTMTVGLGLGQVPVYMPPGGLSSAPYGMMKGRPMQPTEFNATLGTEGDLMLVDMSQMLSIAKGGIEQAISMHVEFLTDQLALRFTMRLGAKPWENSAITPYKGSTLQSSNVALQTRS